MSRQWLQDAAIKALAAALAPKAKVMRDGKLVTLEALNLVPGGRLQPNASYPPYPPLIKWALLAMHRTQWKASAYWCQDSTVKFLWACCWQGCA
jgi:hypothetical protein